MRLRINGKPRPHLSEDQQTQLDRAKIAADELGWEPLRGPVVLRLRFVFEDLDPRGRVPVNEPDVLALATVYRNALCGWGWENAKQVLAVHAAKEHGNVNATLVEFAS